LTVEGSTPHATSNQGLKDKDKDKEKEMKKIKEKEKDKDCDNDKDKDKDNGKTGEDHLTLKRKTKESLVLEPKVGKMRKSSENPEGDSDSDGIKWDYLEHHGVLFAEPWQCHHVSPLYNGEKVELTAFQEELATYWAQTIGSEWEKNAKYLSNFLFEFQKAFSPVQWRGLRDFKLWDFSPLRQHLEQTKEQKKLLTKEEKSELAEKRAKLLSFYGGAIVDGIREKTGSYLIEAPTLFKGRGKHPKAGLLKQRIFPEDLTINVSKDAPVPRC